jgi:hypothetical protein
VTRAVSRERWAKRIFLSSVKKWSAVALWAWDIVVDNCAICRNHIMDLCIECQANQASSTNEGKPFSCLLLLSLADASRRVHRGLGGVQSRLSLSLHLQMAQDATGDKLFFAIFALLRFFLVARGVASDVLS